MFIPLKNHYWAKKCGDNYFIFHAINGEPFLLTNDIFEKIRNDELRDEIKKDLNDAGYYTDDRLYDLNHQKTLDYIEHYDGPIVLDLVLSENCNLSCHMCLHAQTTSQNNLRTQHKKLMDFETAKLWIDYYVDDYPARKKLKKYIFHYGNKNIGTLPE